jgi:DNA primase
VGIFIPTHLLDRILAETDIVELVSSYFPLKKSGRNYKALCPFHAEKTPSFMVNQEKQIFKCFGCGKGGNAFHFLMEKEGLPFQEDAGKERSREEMFTVMSFAVAYYRERLTKATGEAAMRYLVERGLSEESIKKFQLGFAPNAWDSFLNRATREFRISLLEQLGLVLARESGSGHYDRFRNRIMFPIFDPRGRAIGFSGRSLPGETKEDVTPKYINSPESPLFNKREILYGLNFSRSAIAKENRAIVCEGHMDLIAIDQAGFGNAVAVQGTAFTDRQARLLKRYCSEVVFAFDSDSAGQEATLRSFEPLMEVELDVRVAVVPSGYDPDLLIRKKGPEAFKDLVENAVELVDFQYDVLRKQQDEGTLSGRRAIASQMLLTAHKSPSDIVRNAWLQKISKALEIPEATLRAEMRRIHGSSRPFERRGVTPYGREEVRANFATVERERDLIGYMLGYEAVREEVGRHMSSEDFSDPICRRLAEKILSATKRKETIRGAALLQEAENLKEADLISGYLAKPLQPEKPLDAAEDLIQRMVRRKQQEKRKKLQEMIVLAKKEGRDQGSLLAEYNLLLKAEKGL